ncbi:MAG: FHA domain-containing protein [Deltaproteobacteria bacterium]|nr:FHA domain-containing protein [Deltaproteobacteria bacterium]
MSSDPNKKSPRTFQCRDMLWETFEQMARELECSVDYLINEAMKQYARQRSYGGRTPYPSQQGPRDPNSAGYPSAPPPPMPAPPSMRSGGLGGGGGMGGMPRGGGGGLPPPPARSGALPAPPPPPRGGGIQSGLGMQPPPRMASGMQPGRSQPPSAPRSAPPPIPGRSPSLPPMPQGGGGGGGYNGGLSTGAQLSIIYQGEKVGVSKDRFVIGRGKQSSDLTLKDPNVSRQHAMIEYQNGVYFMVDMGSTNGVEYNGQRIARKQIAEGDVFRICDHDLRFTYR